jgi:hypothetical protein
VELDVPYGSSFMDGMLLREDCTIQYILDSEPAEI